MITYSKKKLNMFYNELPSHLKIVIDILKISCIEIWPGPKTYIFTYFNTKPYYRNQNRLLSQACQSLIQPYLHLL